MTPGDPLVRWDWVVDHLGDIGFRLGEHIVFTAVAVGVGFVVSFALVLLSMRRPDAAGPVTAVAGILYTIPSLALFALLIPFTGLSFLTAEIALVSYTILILVRNISAGVAGVPADVREAAAGMGHTRWQRLWRVELPIATPVIVGGLRVATVTIIGLVTVTALIGQGGLGHFIVEGRDRFDSTKILTGGTLSVALAFASDGAFVLLQRLLTPWNRRGP